MCLKCMKNAHFSKWAGLMEGNLKYVCNHNSNVHTAFSEYRKNYMRVVWSNLRHVNRQKWCIRCQLTTSTSDFSKMCSAIKYHIGQGLNLSWIGIFPIIPRGGVRKNVLKMHEKRTFFKMADFLGGGANGSYLQICPQFHEECLCQNV